jgi:hypothetical protein
MSMRPLPGVPAMKTLALSSPSRIRQIPEKDEYVKES